ncbi:hypothetical protein N7E81_09760 [Reichenbachiella carrageenanivorans]|uniref:Uncharacterized protein n=1 Tax=Reichenbachiella carrageenanivorans TaxID=2979869 RepID=A0ABY6CUQ4_9BACT|nr:hypothetical protein [Reichenbachiella carrageenanivorans]UXX77654.1 hypothetical protein N7E81_09760 [Reichenbachiella carrageenanivorans]
MLKKLKILFLSVLAIGLSSFLLYVYMDEVLPKGEQGEAADKLADQMLSAIGDEAWQRTGAISWAYEDRTYVWDKKRHFTKVVYEGREVLIDINDRVGYVVANGEELAEADQKALCEKAWRYWCNDSFWLNPISKIFDSGTQRRLVNWQGEEALLVTYTSGGATPGDSYLWLLDENNRPKSWKMWVSIIPVGGLKFSWDSWETLETGVQISTHHFNPLRTIRIHEPVAAFHLNQLTNRDIFALLLSDTSQLVNY